MLIAVLMKSCERIILADNKNVANVNHRSELRFLITFSHTSYKHLQNYISKDCPMTVFEMFY